MRLAALAFSCLACSSARSSSGFTDNPPVNDAGTLPDGTTRPPSDSSPGNPSPTDAMLGTQTFDTGPADGSITVVTTIYANTDDTLYSMDPMTQAVTPIGIFSGLPDAAYESVTDCAVNAAGDVYVITESAVYSAALPSTPGPAAMVPLTLVATITAAANTDFYALAFTPAGVLGPGEMLVGGDGKGELWSIDPTSGATQDLGNFGSDPANSGNVYALSGDVVFYTDATNQPTGLATIRSCKSGSSTCYPTSAPGDFLAGIDMTALAAAYASKTPSTSLLKGIYGGSSTGAGSGTGYKDLFGLGAWQGSVYAFSRASTSASNMAPARLISIDTTTGAGTVLPATFSFTDGWSGAGVTTTVTIVLPPPPQVPQ